MIFGEDFLETEGEMSGITDRASRFGEGKGEFKIGKDEDERTNEEGEGMDNDFSRMTGLTDKENEGGEEDKVDGEKAVGQLEESREIKEVEKDGLVFGLVAQKEIEGQKDGPERIDLEMGKIDKVVAGKKEEKAGEKTTPVGFGEVGEEEKGGDEGQATGNKIGEIKDYYR